MKRRLFFLCLAAGLLGFVSCVDEDDFDFDRLAQTTFNPSLGLSVFESSVTLDDFLDLDSLTSENEGMELVTVHSPEGDWLELRYTATDTLEVTDFMDELPEVEDATIEYPEIEVPDISEFVSSGIDVSDMELSFPESNLACEDISIRVGNPEEDVRLDSILVRSGSMRVLSETNLPFDVYVELSSSSLKNVVTGQLYRERIKVASPNGVDNSSVINLADYKIFLKDSIGFTDCRFIDMRYRVIIRLGSNTSFTGGTLNLSSRLEFSPIEIGTLFGYVGDVQLPITDTINLSIFDDEEVNSWIQPGTIDLEGISVALSAKTGIGVGAFIVPNIYSQTADGRLTSFDFDNDTIFLQRAQTPGSFGITPETVLNTDAEALEVLPKKIVYNLDAHFSDRFSESTYPSFVQLDNTNLIYSAVTTIPLKAKINDLYYETDADFFDFVNDADVLNSAILRLNLENGFAASVDINFLLFDEQGGTPDTLWKKPVSMKGATVNASGIVVSPSKSVEEATLTKENCDKLRGASKVKMGIKLNTSSEANGNRPYVRFNRKDAIRIKASVKAKVDLTL